MATEEFIAQEREAAVRAVQELLLNNKQVLSYLHVASLQEAYNGDFTAFQADEQVASGDYEPPQYTMYYMASSLETMKLLNEVMRRQHK